MRFKGFTLAELFCILIIVSVLALLFFDIVYPNYVKITAAAKIKKFNSLIRQTQLKAQLDGNNWADYYYTPESIVTASEFADIYVLPYISYLKKDIDEDGNVRIYISEFSFSIKKEDCISFILDINSDKQPHKPGEDLFYFNYCPNTDLNFVKQGEIIPYQTKQVTNRTMALSECKSNPVSCTGLIFLDNYEFAQDYPHKLRS